jgi:hypothetical protein
MDLREPELSIDSGEIPGSRDGWLRVTASDGLRYATAEPRERYHERFEVPAVYPKALGL